MTSCRSQLSHSQRGSVLIVALILCAIIGISLASYIRMARTAMTLSNRALYNNAAMNLAEQGLEEAIYSVNKMVEDPSYAWSGAGWTLSGGNAQQKWTGVALSQNSTAQYRVYISGYNSSNPWIVARSTVQLAAADAAPIEKWIRVTLRGSSRYANGLVARKSVWFKGNNVSVDSFNSTRNNDGTLRGAPVAYSAGVRRDRGSVGSISVSTDAVLVKQADVWGYVSTASYDPTNTVGNNGSILGADSVPDSSWDKSTVDPARISTTFSASFEPETQPGSSVPTIGSIDAAGTYGTAGVARTIVCSDISVSGKNNLVKFQGDVTLIITAAAGSDAISISGNGSGIEVLANSSLKIYTAGDIDLTGQGIVNATSQAKNFEIIGTSTSSVPQDIKIAGGGSFVGKVYAPNAGVTVHGDGAMSGSIVANDITLTGNAAFHYDEALGEPDGATPFRISKWEELTTATARDAVASHVSF
ncbi:DUF7305 domain-containing protein [Opitutus terrae]|uniref:DUF7305 domain-containing protein n=1 Tax=Opitutus terrae (strain DSM 11246 / JCM 15787 / PB90-1) TaxID=452637 RepID=B1ZTJ5_OPITP|nr:hypothetical protein [Opitutus terrae]ACB73940.1 hypothetical protein Oter_0650 [Opitutus terrae PB90-1]